MIVALTKKTSMCKPSSSQFSSPPECRCRYGAVVRGSGAYVPPGARSGKSSTPPANSSSPVVAVTPPPAGPSDTAKKSTNGSDGSASNAPKVGFSL